MLARKRSIIAMLIMVLTGIGLGGAVALATPSSQIENVNSQTAINDWNDGGFNNPVKMYALGQNNNDFFIQPINPCNSHPINQVTPTCPFTVGSGMNTATLGSQIFQVVYNNNGLCVATAASGGAVLGTCNNLAGTGGSSGTIQVALSQCTNSTTYANRYWSDINGSFAGWDNLLGNGAALILDSGTPQGCYVQVH